MPITNFPLNSMLNWAYIKGVEEEVIFSIPDISLYSWTYMKQTDTVHIITHRYDHIIVDSFLCRKNDSMANRHERNLYQLTLFDGPDNDENLLLQTLEDKDLLYCNTNMENHSISSTGFQMYGEFVAALDGNMMYIVMKLLSHRANHTVDKQHMLTSGDEITLTSPLHNLCDFAKVDLPFFCVWMFKAEGFNLITIHDLHYSGFDHGMCEYFGIVISQQDRLNNLYFKRYFRSAEDVVLCDTEKIGPRPDNEISLTTSVHNISLMIYSYNNHPLNDINFNITISSNQCQGYLTPTYFMIHEVTFSYGVKIRTFDINYERLYNLLYITGDTIGGMTHFDVPPLYSINTTNNEQKSVKHFVELYFKYFVVTLFKNYQFEPFHLILQYVDGKCVLLQSDISSELFLSSLNQLSPYHALILRVREDYDYIDEISLLTMFKYYAQSAYTTDESSQCNFKSSVMKPHVDIVMTRQFIICWRSATDDLFKVQTVSRCQPQQLHPDHVGC